LEIEVYCARAVFDLCRNPTHGDIFVAAFDVKLHSSLEDATSH